MPQPWKQRRAGWIRTVSWAFLWLALGLYLLDKTARMQADPDLWGYLAFGRLFWQGGFPYKDAFAFTPIKELWIYHEWLLGVLYYKAVSLFGLQVLQYVKYATLLLTLFVLVVVARKRGGRAALVYLVALYVMPVFTMNASPTRAKVFSHLFFAVTVLVLEAARTGKQRLLLWLPPLFLVWANLHGEVAVGFLAFLAYAVGAVLDGRRREGGVYAATGLGCLAITAINPYGTSLWTFFLYAWKHPRPDILEWRSIFAFIADKPEFGVFFATLAVIVLAGVLLGRDRRDWISLLMLCGFLVAAAKSVRMLTYLCMAIILYVPALLDGAVEKVSSRVRPWRGVVLPALALVALGYSVWQAGRLWRRDIVQIRVEDAAGPVSAAGAAMYYPVDGLRFLRETRQAGRIIPQFEWGEYLLWTLPPAFKVGMDGRYETVYDDAYTRDYFAFVHGERDPAAFLDKYGADVVLLKNKEKAVARLRRTPGWLEVFHTDGYSMFYSTSFDPGR